MPLSPDFIDGSTGLVTRALLEQTRAELVRSLEAGEILIPAPIVTVRSLAGGVNHCPDSDLSYSRDAATVQGTLPATAGDGNQEAYRVFRQIKGANIVADAARALKAVGHSLYAAAEGAASEIPDWDRVNGWIRIGAIDGATQYDVAFRLLEKVVSASQRWFCLWRLVALDATPVPGSLQFGVGVWEIAGGAQGWVTGSAFTLGYSIFGVKGTRSINYRVLAQTDSGVAILSSILNVPDAPNALSPDNCVELFYNAGPGFIQFDIVAEEGGIFTHLFSVRNTIDFKYNDDGVRTRGKGALQGWPASPGNNPQALARTRTLRVGAFGGEWALNEVQIRVPNAYNKSLTDADGQFLRFYLTAPTAVNRQLGIDFIFFSTTFNEWAPDKLPPFADGTYPVPSVAPTSANQGTATGVGNPHGTGTGGDACVTSRLPMLVKQKRMRGFGFRRAGDVHLSAEIKGEFRVPYSILEKTLWMAAEYYRIETANGIAYECVPAHRLCLNVDERRYIQARFLKAGETRLHAWVKGKKVFTTVRTVVRVTDPIEIVRYSLAHPAGLAPDGNGHFIAGFSEDGRRGLFCSNNKPRID